MLEIINLPRRSAALAAMKNFDARQATWVVSDLRSKQEIQQYLLAKDGGYEDTSVMRASDLWRLLLKKTRPEIQIVSRDFVSSLVCAYLEEQRANLPGAISSEGAVMSAMDRFAGIVFHPQGDELMEEWFAANPDSRLRWGGSYLIARLCLKMFRDQQKIMTAKWAAALLQTEENFEKYWDIPLIVDLGAELTGAEAQLFLRLSKVTQVTLLQPAPTWKKDAASVLRPYLDVEGIVAKKKTADDEEFSLSKRTALRLSGQLAEVKSAVATTREWLEQGVPPNEIAILAPEIEDYWPVLRHYLVEEGIPADKAVAVKMNSFPSINKWLAKLRPRRGELTAADLELSFYASDSANRLRHEEFRSLFANIYGEEDLHRHALVKEAYLIGPKFTDLMMRDPFLLAVAQLWDGRDEVAPVEQIIREIYKNASPGTTLPLREWIRYVEAVAANQEMTLAPADAGGILVTKIGSARSARLRKRIFLGLTEEGLRKAELVPIPLSDVARLSDLGFHLEHPDQSALEFEVRWLLDSGAEEDLLLVGISTFEGAVRAPSSLWLRSLGDNPKAHDVFDLPGQTRWDLLQQAHPKNWKEDRGWSEQQGEGVISRLEIDLGDIPAPLVHAKTPQKISPSLIKSYIDCPFIVTATSLFRLKGLEQIDLDLARRGLGTLSHSIFQTLTDEGWISRADVTDEEIIQLIESRRKDMKFTLAEENWWPPFLKRQLRIVREFLKVEAAWKKQYPALKLLSSEQAWTISFNTETGEFIPGAKEGHLAISGRIDRLESDGGEKFVVIDYKAGTSGLSDHGDWIEKNDLQLLFYMWALERGALAGIRGHVIGAFYYVYKNFSRTRGFQIEQEAGKLFPAAPRAKKRQATEEQRNELLNALELEIVRVVKAMKNGEWAPNPRDEKICNRCDWNGLCRAPHLN